jgi:hypothetical protein
MSAAAAAQSSILAEITYFINWTGFLENRYFPVFTADYTG